MGTKGYDLLSLILSWNSFGIIINHLLFKLLKVTFNSIEAKSNFIEETLHTKNELRVKLQMMVQFFNPFMFQGTLPSTCLSCLCSQNTGNSLLKGLRTWRWWRGSLLLSGNVIWRILVLVDSSRRSEEQCCNGFNYSDMSWDPVWHSRTHHWEHLLLQCCARPVLS